MHERTNLMDGLSASLPLDRRTVLARGAALSAMLPFVASEKVAAEEMPHDHSDMGEMDHSAHMAHMGGAKHQTVIDAALACINKGEVCTAHCIEMLGTGDTSLKDCLRSVSEMMPMCAALARLAALDARRLKELARVCGDVCDDCLKECKKHADHHAACKACAETCESCVKECKKLTDA